MVHVGAMIAGAEDSQRFIEDQWAAPQVGRRLRLRWVGTDLHGGFSTVTYCGVPLHVEARIDPAGASVAKVMSPTMATRR